MNDRPPVQRLLIHNLGTRDLHLEDAHGQSLLTGNHLASPEWRERLARRLKAGRYRKAEPRSGVDGPESSPCLLLEPAADEADGAPARITSARLAAYLREAAPDRVILNTTLQDPAHPTDTEWAYRLFEARLQTCYGREAVEEPYDATSYFRDPAAVYPEMRARLEALRQQHPEAEWFVTLTGGLPMMQRALAFLALELLTKVTVLETADPQDARVTPTVFPSPVSRRVRLRAISSRVEAYDYGGAAALALPYLGEGSPAVALLRSGAARLDHRYAEARRQSATSAELWEPGQAERTDRELELLAAEAETACPLRLGEQVYCLEVFFRQGRLRPFVLELHVFLTWLFLLFAVRKLGVRVNEKGVVEEPEAAPEALAMRPLKWSRSLFQHPTTLEKQWKHLAGERSTTPGLPALAVLADVASDPRDELAPEAGVLMRMLMPTGTDQRESARNEVAHRLVEVDEGALLRELGRYLPGRQTTDETRLSVLLRQAYAKASCREAPPALETDSPYSTLNAAWGRFAA